MGKAKILNNIKSYYVKVRSHFLEFLMLFLAVFLGFLADNLRDSFVEKRIEKELVTSLIKDIEVDKANIIQTIEVNQFRINNLDSLSNLCFSYGMHKDDTKLYNYYEVINGETYFFMPNEQTIKQLNYTNGLRLIESKKVVREILKYNHRKEELKKQENYCLQSSKSVSSLGLRLFNQWPFKQKTSYRKHTGQIWKGPIEEKLIINDTILVNEFANRVYLYQRGVEYYNIMLRHTGQNADSLILQLRKEYSIN